MSRLIVVLLWIPLFFSCSKEEGEGGNSVITGKILSKVYNNTFTQLIDTVYKPEMDVYIIYGNNPTYNDRYRTSWDGRYRFEYLRKGNYKIFAYSVDTARDGESVVIPVTVDVKIPGNNDVVNVTDIVVFETSDYDKGTSSISGKVYVLDFNAERTTLLDSYYGPEENVYIVFGNDNFYFDDVKTYFDGSFQFNNLVKGRYIVYALSNNMADISSRQSIPVSDTIEITENYQHIELNDLIIFK